MSSGRNPAADRAYLAAVLHAELDDGADAHEIAERWGIPREIVGRLLAEAEREQAEEMVAPPRRPPARRLLQWFWRSMA